MGIFSAIMDRLRHVAAAHQQTSSGQQTQQQTASGTAAQQSAGAPPIQNVDVEAVLSQLAAKKGGGNWRESIVDLLKLLDLDSSLDARKKLADELDVHAGAPGTAEENIALHKAVMRKVAENGGKVPDSMKH